MIMRITGGKYCNRKVIIPEGDLEIRPAMDRMRESLFSILSPLDDSSFCDLFAGSGCVGLEAASRGANTVHFVELDSKKKTVLEQNVKFALNDCNVRIYIQDVFEFLRLSKTSYDTVYADPPFPMENKIQIAELVSQYNRVVTGGRFVIHIPKNELSVFPEQIGMLHRYDVRTYGRNTFLFYLKQVF